MQIKLLTHKPSHWSAFFLDRCDWLKCWHSQCKITICWSGLTHCSWWMLWWTDSKCQRQMNREMDFLLHMYMCMYFLLMISFITWSWHYMKLARQLKLSKHTWLHWGLYVFSAWKGINNTQTIMSGIKRDKGGMQV